MPNPIRLTPEFQEKIWGSRNLEPWFRDTPGKTGEVWFHEKGSPILVKFLFTTENLSVQVHPGDTADSCGKTEMWRILRAEPGAKIALGLRETLTREQLREASLDGSIMDLLRWIPVAAGDAWFVPAGAIHALGAGLALCEIQQNSDVTYRLFDYGRRRELHLDRALEVANPSFRAEPLPRNGLLMSCPYFRTEAIDLEETATLAAGDWMIVHEGGGNIGEERFVAGEVWRVEEATPLDGVARVIRVGVPPSHVGNYP